VPSIATIRRPTNVAQVPRNGDRTRQLIIEAAQRLFAERGIDGVSLREINDAAGQRNKSALQYHFADRNGLLAAIAATHMPAIEQRQQELFDEVATDGLIGETRGFVEVCARPVAERLGQGPGARSWIIVTSELVTHPRTDTELLSASATPLTVAAGRPVFERLAALTDEAFAIHRLRSATEAALHLVADRARHENAPDRSRPMPALPEFIDDLIEMTIAAIDAPVPVHAGATRKVRT